jgi:predicted RNase H-like nuclease (RuvC/YqgF family)
MSKIYEIDMTLDHSVGLQEDYKPSVTATQIYHHHVQPLEDEVEKLKIEVAELRRSNEKLRDTVINQKRKLTGASW